MIRLAVGALLLTVATPVGSQGVATAGIQGTVRTSENRPLENARVEITHRETGYVVTVEARRGRYFVQGLEPGGPYSILVRHPGFSLQRRDNLTLTLGELREENWILQPAAVILDPATIVGTGHSSSSRTHGGTASLIDGTMLGSLPTFNRDVYDFVRLVPQVSTKISLSNPGFSAGGMGFRFNNFLIGGVSERTSSGSVSGAFGGVKSVPVDAIREYQVLLAPYDVRYGDFAGALVNAVTKSGTNKPEGSAFFFARNDHLARISTAPGGSRYDLYQYGFTFGGPIVRDRAHFFVAPEIQHYAYPAPGPYLGQPEDAKPDVPVSEDDLGRLTSIMKEKYGLTAGSAGAMRNGNPLHNLFSRIDVSLPAWNTRVTAWHSYGRSEEISLSRDETFTLSSSRISRFSRNRIGAVQIQSILPGSGGHNELLVSTRSEGIDSDSDILQPIVRVLLPGSLGGREPVVTGTPETGHGSAVSSSTFAIKDNLTIPVSRTHTIALGGEAAWTRIRRKGVLNAFGTWEFASLEDLETGTAARYDVGLDFGVSPAPLHAAQYAAYVSDHWDVKRRLSLTAGLRADLLDLRNRAPYHGGVDTAFGIRTDRLPRRRIELSPRLGFVADMGPAGSRLRGGAGIFVTRFPLGWAHTSLLSYGAGGGTLRCGRASSDLGLPPAFDPDPQSPPQACANGATIVDSRRGDVDVLDSDLRMMRILRGSLAYDRTLLGNLEFTGELLISSAISDFVFENLRLNEPAGADPNGRVMYGSIGPSGIPNLNLRSRFSEVISIRNEPHTRAVQLSGRLGKTVGRMNTVASYTYSRVRDAMTPVRVNNRGLVAWGSARVVSGRHDDYTRGISSNDIPHRLVLAGTWSLARRWGTELSFCYVGESGRPFTFVAFGDAGAGDLNADGVSSNDPVYVPQSAFDEREILFDGDPAVVETQRSAFESLISETSCLRRQRGEILERNSCREPWSNTTLASLRQKLSFVSSGLEVQLDIFNVLNLLNSDWGSRIEALPGLLKHVRQSSAQGTQARSIFLFDPSRALSREDGAASSFQLQAAVRYRF